jgi:hypothetical protein
VRRDDPVRAAEWRRQIADALMHAVAQRREVRLGERGYVVIGGAS